MTESRRPPFPAVQRKLKIGYNQAANLVESMESAGVVGLPDIMVHTGSVGGSPR